MMPDWPYSTAASSLLIEPHLSVSTLMTTSYKELVMRGALTLTPHTVRRRTSVLLAVGAPVEGLPRELRVLLGALSWLPAEGLEIRKVMEKMSRKSGLPADVRRAAIRTLVGHGFLEEKPRLLLGVRVGTKRVQSEAGAVVAADFTRYRALAAKELPTLTAAQLAELPPAILLTVDKRHQKLVDRTFQSAGADAGAFNAVGFSDMQHMQHLHHMHHVETAVHHSGADGGHHGGGGGGGHH